MPSLRDNCRYSLRGHLFTFTRRRFTATSAEDAETQKIILQTSAASEGVLNSYFRSWLLVAACASITACSLPTPPPSNLPTAPAVLDITPAPTLDIDATATSYASLLRPTPTPAGLYIVKQGDTLGGLAQQFGTTVEELMAANNINDPNALQVGQALIIPSLLVTPRAETVQPEAATVETAGTVTSETTSPISVTSTP